MVLIGISTGGPPALETLLGELPGDFPWPLVIAQHMPATFTGPLANRLNGHSRLTVLEVREPVLLQTGCAYIAQGRADIVFAPTAKAGRYAVAAEQGYPWHPSVDRLVRSALDHVPARQLLGC